VDKQTKLWSLREMVERFATIEFPEYQREPNVWSRDAKQRLIDSIMRSFDIASVYLYETGPESFDCIDGRQRIGAIMSFFGENAEDNDNKFQYKVLNEIYNDEAHPYQSLDGLTLGQIRDLGETDRTAADFVDAVEIYPLTVVLLSGSRDPLEFNLQFTRLNLGTIINSGEKLHAMVGELRDVCFAADGLGAHPFLEAAGIPTRRYSREQLAAQIMGQVLSLAEDESFGRTRHFDLQKLFKEHTELNNDEREIVGGVRSQLDNLHAAFEQPEILRNRAITVSTVILAWRENFNGDDARDFAKFLTEFLCRLQWQIKKGLDVDDQYRYLIEFQRHVTQASVEKTAVERRHEVLREQFELFRHTDLLSGDKEFAAVNKSDPAKLCRQR
jgi:hypothetical protein